MCTIGAKELVNAIITSALDQGLVKDEVRLNSDTMTGTHHAQFVQRFCVRTGTHAAIHWRSQEQLLML
ncbi:hypothetical protein SmphiM12_497 [Sinorhizobium phage phiM12]|uniref:Uncharacterized protein n=1 Tax=Sinorhizobium phage phiM12 TaxID=1357423 RepID=A0A068NZ98_9CAUD|nr:hypothetical protein AB690_gp035 [Sinorhizobium phage phiM12]AIF27781.1 hypothetical protein SmphiM12_497 [Sinorhizobium phage phiM12]